MDDSLVKYINQLKQIPRLTSQEEKRLLKKIMKGDEDAIIRIANNYLMLAVRIAFRYSNKCEGTILEVADLINEAYKGLIRAAQKFDDKKCPIFLPYAVYWIRQKITGALYDHSKTIRISVSGTNQSDLYAKIKDEAAQLEKEISLEEIAEKMGISAKDTEKLKKTLKLIYEAKVISTETPIKGVRDRWNTGVIDNLISDEKIPNPEEMFQIQQMKEKARKMLLTCSPREEKVLRMRFGIGEKKDYTLRETGQLLGGITREQVRQSEARGLRKLRKEFTVEENKEFFDFDDYL